LKLAKPLDELVQLAPVSATILRSPYGRASARQPNFLLVLRLHLSSAGGQMRELIDLYRQREEGAIGYILLWLMGVPASILFLIFLLRGCN
jgi:hypothetical protein